MSTAEGSHLERIRRTKRGLRSLGPVRPAKRSGSRARLPAAANLAASDMRPDLADKLMLLATHSNTAVLAASLDHPMKASNEGKCKCRRLPAQIMIILRSCSLHGMECKWRCLG